MSKRKIETCQLETCPNRFIVNSRGRPRKYCCDAHKQADQRLKDKEKLKTKLDLMPEELAKFSAIMAVYPEAGAHLDRIEKLCGEIALIEAIRLMLLFTPVRLTPEVRA